MHIFSLPWKIVRYLGCTRPGKMDATTDVNRGPPFINPAELSYS